MLKPAARVALAATLIAIAGPAAADGMNADNFYQRAIALKKKGAMAIFSGGEIKRLVAEIKFAGNKVKATRLFAESHGGHGRYCPPRDSGQMKSDEYLASLGAIPQVERLRIDLVEATTRIMEKKFPCRTS